jgi:hypothetical protein
MVSLKFILALLSDFIIFEKARHYFGNWVLDLEGVLGFIAYRAPGLIKHQPCYNTLSRERVESHPAVCADSVAHRTTVLVYQE